MCTHHKTTYEFNYENWKRIYCLLQKYKVIFVKKSWFEFKDERLSESNIKKSYKVFIIV